MRSAQASSSDQAGLLDTVVALHRMGHWPEKPQEIYGRGMALMNQHAATDPRGAVSILDAIAPLAPKGEDLHAIRRELLEKAVASAPDDSDLASQLAAVYEAQGQEARCASLLEVHRGRLGTTEGARILGLIDARQGRLQPSLALLRPYTRTRLDRFHAAEQKLKSAVTAAQKKVIDRLESQRPDDFDVAGYQRATTAEQTRMLENYVAGKLKNDPSIDAAEQEMLQESSIVPVALELGMILLQHAQTLTDPKNRKEELEEAEKTFLAVGRLAGETEEFRLNLAQVYYWQGKHKEGRALFDEVLKARKRDPKLLVEISELLRRVGSDHEARTLAEECYNAATDPQLKQTAAVQRGLLGVDLDDRIIWLRRGNSAEPFSKALLAGDLAYQALQHGQETAAVGHLREAVKLYGSLPESPASLNNSALAQLRLGVLTGEQDTLDRALAMIDKANKLDPSNSLTMRNAGTIVLEWALRDIIGGAIDLRLLKEDAGLTLLPYLYRDQAGRQESSSRLRSHVGINRAIGLLEKALVLSPRSDQLAEVLNHLYHARGDLERLRNLEQRLRTVEFDQVDSSERYRQYYRGDRDDELRQDGAKSLARHEAILTSVRASHKDLTLAVAVSKVAWVRMEQLALGIETDRDAIVSLADEAYAVAPSHATRRTLIEALCCRAVYRLGRAQPDFAANVTRTLRSTAHSFLATLAVDRDGPLGQAARKDPDVLRVAKLIAEGYDGDPVYVAGPRSWCFLRVLDPNRAAKIKETYAHAEADQLSQVISLKVNSMNGSEALESYWAAVMAGKEAEGLSILKAFEARGVPLPHSETLNSLMRPALPGQQRSNETARS